MKKTIKILTFGSIFLFSTQSFAITWFNITGKWSPDNSPDIQLKIIQQDNDIKVILKGGKVLKGKITQKALNKFSILAYNTEKFDYGCVINTNFSVRGEKISSSALSIGSCRFIITDSCYPDEPSTIPCDNDIWFNKNP